ncbi:hypothetical protein [Sphaerochaeta halotolerans]|nr:hypothetical protein [Sphaerochaeta halotolerans]MXI86752.1 hypothetical protein [Sphaerochaeta halotolerans]
MFCLVERGDNKTDHTSSLVGVGETIGPIALPATMADIVNSIKQQKEQT